MNKFFRTISLLILVTTAFTAPAAGLGELNIFNHLGVGVHAGTTGFGFEAATPITKWVTLRGGVTIMPGISFNTDVDGTYHDNREGHECREARYSMSIPFRIFPHSMWRPALISAGAGSCISQATATS